MIKHLQVLFRRSFSINFILFFTGKINYIQFSYILSENFELESSDIEQIVNILDPDSTKIISHDLFKKILQNSNNIEELLKNYYNSI